MPQPRYDEVVKLKTFAPPRATDKTVSPDRFGTFSRSVAYNSWKRSLYTIEWFDSRPEREVANTLDDSAQITCWVRLHTGELPILWTSGGRKYNPDFLVIETDRTHWIVEVKADRDLTSADVQGKRQQQSAGPTTSRPPMRSSRPGATSSSRRPTLPQRPSRQC